MKTKFLEFIQISWRSIFHSYFRKIFTLYAAVKGKLLKKVSIGIFPFRLIKNGETDFKMQSFQTTSYLGLQLPRFNLEILRNVTNRHLTPVILNKNQQRAWEQLVDLRKKILFNNHKKNFPWKMQIYSFKNWYSSHTWF